MNIISNFDPIIQTSIKYFSNSAVSLNHLAQELDISKQAVHKRVAIGADFFNSFRSQVKV